MYQRGMAMLEAAGAMQEALQTLELTQQFRRFRAEGCAPALTPCQVYRQHLLCLLVMMWEAAGAMHGALQAPWLSESFRTLVTYAWACLSSQNKMARNVCRECTWLSVHSKQV